MLFCATIFYFIKIAFWSILVHFHRTPRKIERGRRDRRARVHITMSSWRLSSWQLSSLVRHYVKSVSSLSQRYRSVLEPPSTKWLRQLFPYKAVPSVSSTVLQHLKRSQKSLNKIELSKPDELNKLVENVVLRAGIGTLRILLFDNRTDCELFNLRKEIYSSKQNDILNVVMNSI